MCHSWPQSTMADRLWTGIERHATGCRARVSRGTGLPRVARDFPLTTPPHIMQTWREEERAKHVVTRKKRASIGTFEGDVKRYLAIVTAMPSLVHRTIELNHWVKVFGTQLRATITSSQIRAQRDR